MRTRFLLALTAFVVVAASPAAAQERPGGRFSGRVVAEWLVEDGPDRKLRLVETFEFVGPSGKKWVVPVGAVVDGASIPRALWTIIGSPFTGDYRRASVVHDYYCVTKTDTWQSVHLMFYEASLAGGTSVPLAKTMYAGVLAGGPRWETRTIKGLEGEQLTLMVPLAAPGISEAEMEEVREWIEMTNPSIQEIQKRMGVSN